MEYTTYGRHVAVDAWGIDYMHLNDSSLLTEQMILAAEASGAAVLSVQANQFKPQGATVLVLLSESHMSIHTYPEKGFAALDCYTCGESVDPKAAIATMLGFLKPKETSAARLARGSGVMDVAMDEGNRRLEAEKVCVSV